MNTSIKKIASEYTHQIWNEKQIDAVDRFVHQNVIIHSSLGKYSGVQAMKKIVHVWLDGFPNLRVDVDNIISENDLVSIQWQAHGIHSGEFKNILPTGKVVSYCGVTIYRIRNEKIVEYWAYLDMKHLLNQIE